MNKASGLLRVARCVRQNGSQKRESDERVALSSKFAGTALTQDVVNLPQSDGYVWETSAGQVECASHRCRSGIGPRRTLVCGASKGHSL